ncbi:MAG: DUF362 domain-containing protein, partial [Candidatus Saganbacteria bacterium]|nr:DUF362 domain-containing protein [Candidatus Saganbacteria bacterium]
DTKVALVKCSSYNQKEVDCAVFKCLDLLGGLKNFIKPGKRVLIKPNILMGAPPEKAAATHPSIVRALIRAIRKVGAVPLVGDSPGFESSKKAAQGAGILKVVNEEGVAFCELKVAKDVAFKEALFSRNMKIAKDVLDADAIINVGKLKSHGYSGITACVKNLFGVVPGLVKSQYHLRFPRKNDFDLMLLDILRFVKPVLNIVDCVTAMEGEGGPATGSPRNLNLIIAGSDAVAVDSVCAALTGKKPHDFNFLKMAEKFNVGQTKLEKISVLGEKLENNICHDFKHIPGLRDEMLPNWIPKPFIPFMRKILLDRPILDKGKCAKCGVCAKVCAAGALTIVSGYPSFDYSKCIGCYCCQEMCRFGAISVKKSFLARLALKMVK